MKAAAACAVALLALAGCAHRPPPGEPGEEGATARPPPSGEAAAAARAAEARLPQVGLASFYGRYHRGKPTASGEPYDPSRLTCAHRTLPFGTRLRVTSLDSGRSVVVRVNDRGPFVRGRLVDLSTAAAHELGMVHAGVARVRLEAAE